MPWIDSWKVWLMNGLIQVCNFLYPMSRREASLCVYVSERCTSNTPIQAHHENLNTHKGFHITVIGIHVCVCVCTQPAHEQRTVYV